MAIISDDNDFEIQNPKQKNPIIKTESIEYDKTFENSIRPKTFDDYINLTGKIRNSLNIDRREKEELIKFINCSDCKFFNDKNKIIEIFRLFYNDDIVNKIISLGKEE